MAGGKDLSRAEFSAIEVYFQETFLSQREIARQLVVSKTALAKVKRKNYEPGYKGKKGCPPRQGRMLVNMVKQDCSTSSQQMANEWKNYGVECKPSTSRKKLTEMGCRACRPSCPTNVLGLTAPMRQNNKPGQSPQGLRIRGLGNISPT